MTARDEDRSKVKLAVLVRELRDNIAAHIEIAQLDARLKRAKYLALIKEGFDERQALELCK
jgi:hypothetical protein